MSNFHKITATYDKDQIHKITLSELVNHFTYYREIYGFKGIVEICGNNIITIEKSLMQSIVYRVLLINNEILISNSLISKIYRCLRIMDEAYITSYCKSKIYRFVSGTNTICSTSNIHCFVNIGLNVNVNSFYITSNMTGICVYLMRINDLSSDTLSTMSNKTLNDISRQIIT